MSAVITRPALTRFKLTVEQYHRMGEAGILHEDDRVELIDGELIRMAPIGSLHGGLLSRLNRLLVIEVADSTLRYDRDYKLRFYAASGVPEVWIVDARGRRALRFLDPGEQGYRVAATLAAGQTLECAGLPALRIGVDELFGPA